MVKVNIHQAKTHLSRYLAQVEQGETVLVCRRNEPIAEIRPVKHPQVERRPVDLAAGTFEVPDSFYEPLPDDLVDAFSGKAS